MGAYECLSSGVQGLQFLLSRGRGIKVIAIWESGGSGSSSSDDDAASSSEVRSPDKSCQWITGTVPMVIMSRCLRRNRGLRGSEGPGS